MAIYGIHLDVGASATKGHKITLDGATVGALTPSGINILIDLTKVTKISQLRLALEDILLKAKGSGSFTD